MSLRCYESHSSPSHAFAALLTRLHMPHYTVATMSGVPYREELVPGEPPPPKTDRATHTATGPRGGTFEKGVSK
jgi:hypothetical protein